MVTYLFSDKIPLRRTDAWENYKVLQTIPRGYGTITISPVPYDENGYVWVLLDHPIHGIIDDGVRRSGNIEAAYDWWNGVDSTGHACSFLEVAEPANPGDLSVTLQAMIHPTTGGFVTYPADVAWDIYNLIRGGEVSEAIVDIYRRECQELGLEVSGIIDDNTQPVRNIFDNLAESTGSVFGAGIPSLFRVYPREIPDNEPIYDSFNSRNIRKITNNKSKYTDIYTVLQVNYDFDFSTGNARKTLELKADEPAKDLGEIVKEIDLTWIKSPRIASQIGERKLQYLARKKFSIEFVSRKGTPSGGFVYFSHPFLPSSLWGYTMVLSTVTHLAKPDAKYTIELLVGDPPEISIISEGQSYT
jgi:hypothetical protein